MRGGTSGSETSNGAPGLLISALFLAFLAATALAAVAEELGTPSSTIVLVLASVAVGFSLAASVAGWSRDLGVLLVAGRRMGAITNAMSVAAAWGAFGVFTVLTGVVYLHGFDGLLPLTGLVGGLVMMLALVTPFVARSGAATIPEFLGLRFGPFVRFVAALLVIASTGSLLLANLAVAGDLAAQLSGTRLANAVMALAAVAALALIGGGLRSATWAGSFQYLVVATSLVLPLGLATFEAFGNPIPYIGYGPALAEIDRLEQHLAEQGLVDFDTFRPFLRPNMEIDPLNWVLIALSIVAATAAMPHLAQRFLALPDADRSRRSVAWTALFALLVLTLAPGYAALIRLEVTRLTAAETAPTDAPEWVERLSATGALSIHGVSLPAFDAARRVVASGVNDPEGIGPALAVIDPVVAAEFETLEPQVKSAIATAAASLPKDATPDAVWRAFRESVVPAAIKAQGGEGGVIGAAALELDPSRIALSLPALGGQPLTLSALMVAGALMAALATLLGLVMTLASALAHDVVAPLAGKRLSAGGQALLVRLAIILVSAGGAAATVFGTALDAGVLMLLAVSVSAVGLWPMLLVAIWVRRATALGVIAGLMAGAVVSAYYVMGTGPYAVTFADTWAAASSADQESVAGFQEAMSDWLAMPEGPGRQEAYAAVREQAAGTLVRPGLANWFGIAPAANAVIGIPVALLFALVIGLMSWRRNESVEEFLALLHGRRAATPAAPQERGEA